MPRVIDEIEKKLGRPLKLERQGLAVIEETENGEWYLMLPNGQVTVHESVKDAETMARRWFKRHCRGDIGVGNIEIRPKN